jgi:hypothetical protein
MSKSRVDVKTALQAWYLLNLRLCNSEKSEIAWRFRDHAEQIGPKTTLVIDLESIDTQRTIDEAFTRVLDSRSSDIDAIFSGPENASISLTTSALAQLFNSTAVEVSVSAENKQSFV